MTTDVFADPGTKRAAPNAVKDDDGVKRDRFGRYLLPECNLGPAPKKEVPFTRATTFAKSISDTYALSAWSQRMVAKGLSGRDSQDLRLAAATLDVRADKDALNEIVEQAKERANARGPARLGSAVHAFTEMLDGAAQGGAEFDTADAQEFAAHVDLYKETLDQHGIVPMPGMIERIVVWKRFSIAGTFDRLATWNGEPVVLDLKTGRDLQYGWNEIAIQLCIYAHADGIWNPDAWRWDPMPDVSRKHALVVHLPVVEDVPRCEVFKVDLEPALTACQLCYDVREWRRLRNLAVPVEPPAGEPTEDWALRITTAASDGELRALWQEIPADQRNATVRQAFATRAQMIRELAG